MAMNIRPKTTVKMKAHAECPSHSLANVEIRDLTVAIDEPTERGGTNLGLTPTESALAALIGCTNVIGNKCADALGIETGHLTISAVCSFDRRGVTLVEEIDVPFPHIKLDVQTQNQVSDEDLSRLSVEVAKFCPLAKLFRQSGTVIDESWSSST